MPELPEVETIRRDLSQAIINHRIVSISINQPKIIKNKNINFFKKNLIDKQIISVNRIGKLLYLELSNQLVLLIHLKMTGQLIYQKKLKKIYGGHSFPPQNTTLPNKYSHIIFHFDNESKLFFNDQRQFGFMQIVKNIQLQKIKSKYGIEPLQPNFTLKNFSAIFTNRKTYLKNILLNQKIISGLGNIYVDEICFDAGINPQTLVSKLNKNQIKKLFASTKKIIKLAIKYRGTTFSDYLDSSGKKGNYSQKLKVYGQSKKICPKCQKTTIKKIKLAGRGTHFCPHCQKI